MPRGNNDNNDNDDRRGYGMFSSRNTASIARRINTGGIDELTEQPNDEAQLITDSRTQRTGTSFGLDNVIHPKLPNLFPLDKSDIHGVSSESFLAALREETEIKDPDTIHRNSYKEMKVLKEKCILDKYVLNDDEAAVVCSIPILLNNDDEFSIKKAIIRCKESTPSKLFVMMFTVLRKLPKYRGHMYIEIEKKKMAKKRERGSSVRLSFCVATKETNMKKESTNTDDYREIFRIEEGWGYDISDFISTRNDVGDEYCRKIIIEQNNV